MTEKEIVEHDMPSNSEWSISQLERIEDHSIYNRLDALRSIFNLWPDAQNDAIETIIKKYEKEDVLHLIESLEDISALIDKIKENPETFFQNHQLLPVDSNALIEMLENWIVRAAGFAYSHAFDEASYQPRTKINLLNAKALLLSSVCKLQRGDGKIIELEDFPGLKIEEKTAAEISPDEQVELRNIFEANWAGLEFNQIYWQLRKGFNRRRLADNPNDRFEIMTSEDSTGKKTIIGYQSFQDRGNFQYVSSNNVRPELRGSGLGELMGRQIFEQKYDGRPIVASASPKLKVAESYFSRGGFVADRIMTNFLGVSREPYFALLYDPSSTNYYYRNLETEKIIVDYNNQTFAENARILKLELPGFSSDREDESKSTEDHFSKELNNFLKDDWVVTRLIRDPENPDMVYIALEKSTSKYKVLTDDHHVISIEEITTAPKTKTLKAA